MKNTNTLNNKLNNNIVNNNHIKYTINQYLKNTLIFAPIILIVYLMWLALIMTFSREIFGYVENFVTALYMIFLLSVGSVVTYCLWFISHSDKLFKSLNLNRPVANTFNILGLFIVPGLSLLATPLIIWFKSRNADLSNIKE